MFYPNTNVRLRKHQGQQMQMLGINLTEDYYNGQMESSRNIDSRKFPYVTTAQQLVQIDTGIPEGYMPISMFAWEKLFVVSNEPSDDGGYKCYYGGKYCGDAVSTVLPKQYAVVNSKLVMFPDKIYFELYDENMKAYPLSSANTLAKIELGTVELVGGGGSDD